MSAFTQDFFTSRRNYADGSTRIGEKDRLWYDSNTNTIRIGDGSTPGGILISGGGAGGGTSTITVSEIDNTGAIFNSKTSINTIRVSKDDGLGVVSLGSGVVKITSLYGSGNLDGGTAFTEYGGLEIIDAGGI